ncbi:hypothetical protein ABH916_000761 [Peribacillus frigoritolerans]
MQFVLPNQKVELTFQNIDRKVIDDKIYLFLIYKKLVSYYY